MTDELKPYVGGYDRQGIRAFIDPSVLLGMGVKVWHFAVVQADVELGIGVSIGSHAEIGFRSKIGAHTRISKGVFLPNDSVVGSRVFIGPNATFTDDKHPRVHKPDEAPYVAEPPVIEDGASIGAGAVILPGVRIGKNARIAAGAIVTKDVPPGALVRSEPARQKPMSGAAELMFQGQPA